MKKIMAIILFGPFYFLYKAIKKGSPRNSAYPTTTTHDAVTVSIETSSSYNANFKPAEDKREAFCPNCGSELAKVPGAKTKCPSCSKYIYVRTDPRINQRILVAEGDLEEIDDEIAKRNGTWEERVRLKHWREDTLANWAEKNTAGMQERDLEWAVLVKEGIWLAGQGDWTGWRRNEYKMGEHVFKEKKYSNACYHFGVVTIADFADSKKRNERYKELELDGIGLDDFESSEEDPISWLEPGLTRMAESIQRGELSASQVKELLSKSFHVIEGTRLISKSELPEIEMLILKGLRL